MVEMHRVERREGDGSGEQIDEKYDGEEYNTKDERADTETTFYKKDINSLNVSSRRKNELHRIFDRQQGIDYGETNREDENSRKEQNREEWQRRVITTYSSQVELSPAQKKRAKHLVMDVLNINKFGPYSVEKVAIGVVNVVAREDGRWIEDEERFRDLMSDVGIENMDKLKSIRQLVRDRIPSH